MAACQAHFTTARPRVGLVFPLQFEEAQALLADAADIVVAPEPTEAGIGSIVDGISALISRGPTPVTAAHIAGAPTLLAIAVTGSGTDHVDVDAAAAAGVEVTSGAGVASQSVAEYVIGAMVVGHRQLLQAQRVLLGGRFDWGDRVSICPEGLMGSTVGLLGYGHIGRRVATTVRLALGAKILVHDPFVTELEEDVELAGSVDDLFTRSQVVSVHVPLLDSTRSLVGSSQLARLGPEGLLVNTSRGGVVDEPALLAALQAGHLGGAWLDVFDPEPAEAKQLRAFAGTPNLVVTPHLAGITRSGRRANEMDAVRRVLLGAAGR
jgi:(S)-sulfolactate dehydrogenase